MARLAASRAGRPGGGIIPAHGLFAQAAAHMETTRQQPIEKRRLGVVSIGDDPDRRLAQAPRHLQERRDRRIPTAHRLDGITDHPLPSALEPWDQPHHQGPTQPPRFPRAAEPHQVPVVAHQGGTPVGVVAMVCPLLHAQHALGGLGDQGGVCAQPVGPVPLEPVAERGHHQRDEALGERCQAPAVLCEEPLPAAESALVEESTPGEARQTCATLDHHQRPHIGPEVGKAGGREAGGKDLQQGQRLGGKEDLHRTPPVCIP
jgi:hypothetical protein